MELLPHMWQSHSAIPARQDQGSRHCQKPTLGASEAAWGCNVGVQPPHLLSCVPTGSLHQPHEVAKREWTAEPTLWVLFSRA